MTIKITSQEINSKPSSSPSMFHHGAIYPNNTNTIRAIYKIIKENNADIAINIDTNEKYTLPYCEKILGINQSQAFKKFN